MTDISKFPIDYGAGARVSGAAFGAVPLNYSFSAAVLPYELEIYSHGTTLFFRIVDGNGKTVEDGGSGDTVPIGNPAAIVRLIATASERRDVWNAKLLPTGG